jgi:dTMP kinase
MKSPEGIQKFIEYKRNVEKERPQLTAEPRLITIDGTDGVGKSTIARKLVEKLQESFGKDKVLLADITNLRGSPKQERLREIAEHKKITEKQLDAFYAAGVNRAYEEIIIPAIKNGKIVVVDRSEVDLLRYAIEHGDKSSIEKRKQYIQDGSITHRFWAGNRIFIDADPKDAWENLRHRNRKSQYDPASLEEMETSAEAQQKAQEYIESLPHTGSINIIKEKVVRVEDEMKREEYLNSVVDKLINNLNLPKSEEKENGDER